MKIVPLSGETIGPISPKKVETEAYILKFWGHPPTPRGGMGGPPLETKNPWFFEDMGDFTMQLFSAHQSRAFDYNI